MSHLQPGGKAPKFKLTDQHSKTVSLADFQGKHVLIYFYPKADTPGCTKQACSVRDSLSQLHKLEIDAVGISPDAPEKQKKFDDKYDLGFTLLSDPECEVAEAYGAWGEKKMFGKTGHGVIRSAFLVDGEGMIAGAWYKVKPLDTVEGVLEVVGETKG